MQKELWLQKKENISCLSISECRGKCDVLWLIADTFLHALVLFYKLISVKFELNLILTIAMIVYLYQ